MRTSLPTAIAAILLLSDSASARKAKRTITIDACAATTTSVSLASKVAAAEASTVTVQPMPVGTIDGVTYSGIATGTGIPSGIFFTGYGSGTAGPTGSGRFHGTGTGAYRSTGGHHNSTRTRTAKASSSVAPTSPDEEGAAAASPTKVTQVTHTTQKPTTVSISSATLAPKPSSTTLSSITLPKPSSTTTTPSSSVVPSTSSAAPSASSTSIPFLRGVNLGGWLVLEKWMNSDLFSGPFSSASDQFTFDAMPGAAAALKTHWDTFFTESDIQILAATGINALRIPIGFWAYDNTNTGYIKGADAYMEKAITWARKYNMKVWVDCHGSPGSQNGFDNSGKAGSVDWQQTANLQRSISVLKTMAAKYGAMEYADVVVGLEMTNEPVSYGNNKFSVTQSWAQEAYTAVKAATKNTNMVIVMHDAFQGASSWTSIAKGLGGKTFGVDTHLYQLFVDSDNKLTQSQHITEACGWASNLASANSIMPTYVGEWSAATNICVNPDGSTTAGTSCSVSGCQCQSASFDSWNSKMIEQVRRFVEAQLDVFESSSSGYFIWSAKGPGGWGFLNGIKNGAIPNPVTARKYPGQCGGSKRREVRGSLGAMPEAF